MSALTPDGDRLADDLAGRYGISRDAVTTLIHAVAQGGGGQAQFSHPELGGMGQWSRGGMTMVGDMFNTALKARVDGLCSEIASRMRETALVHHPAPAAGSHQSQSTGVSYAHHGSGAWWPDWLGTPSSTGQQNDLRYAVFPQSSRLAIGHSGGVTVHDLGDHVISGFSQSQGGGQTIGFTSQHGLVRVSDLPVVSGPAAGAPSPEAADRPTGTPAGPAAQPSSEARRASGAGETDAVFAAIERLADLRDRGILTDEEFSAKKTELLSRL